MKLKKSGSSLVTILAGIAIVGVFAAVGMATRRPLQIETEGGQPPPKMVLMHQKCFVKMVGAEKYGFISYSIGYPDGTTVQGYGHQKFDVGTEVTLTEPGADRVSADADEIFFVLPLDAKP